MDYDTIGSDDLLGHPTEVEERGSTRALEMTVHRPLLSLSLYKYDYIYIYICCKTSTVSHISYFAIDFFVFTRNMHFFK